MIDVNPSPVDNKWYTLPEAEVRQDYLVKTMPTGTGWYWKDTNGNEVVFSGRRASQTHTTHTTKEDK